MSETSQQNAFQLDGVSNRDRWDSGIGFRPSVDSIQEFKIEVNNYSGELGKGADGQINAVTRSETRRLHGSLWGFHRIRWSVNGQNATFRALLTFHGTNDEGSTVSADRDGIQVKAWSWMDDMTRHTAIGRAGNSLPQWAAIDAIAHPDAGFESDVSVRIAGTAERLAIPAPGPARIRVGNRTLEVQAGNREVRLA